MSELVALVDHVPVVAAIVGGLYWSLMAVIAIWGLATKDESRRKAAVEMLRILKPGPPWRKSNEPPAG